MIIIIIITIIVIIIIIGMIIIIIVVIIIIIKSLQANCQQLTMQMHVTSQVPTHHKLQHTHINNMQHCKLPSKHLQSAMVYCLYHSRPYTLQKTCNQLTQKKKLQMCKPSELLRGWSTAADQYACYRLKHSKK